MKYFFNIFWNKIFFCQDLQAIVYFLPIFWKKLTVIEENSFYLLAHKDSRAQIDKDLPSYQNSTLSKEMLID